MYFWRTVLLESSFKSFSIASFDVLEKRFSSASGLSIVFSWANGGGGLASNCLIFSISSEKGT